MDINFDNSLLNITGKLSDKLKNDQIYLKLIPTDDGYRLTYDTFRYINLISPITNIAKELVSCSSQRLTTYTFRQLTRSLICLLHIHKKVDLENESSNYFRSFTIIKILLWIPIIGRIFEYFLPLIPAPWLLTQSVLKYSFKAACNKTEKPYTTLLEQRLGQIHAVTDFEILMREIIAIRKEIKERKATELGNTPNIPPNTPKKTPQKAERPLSNSTPTIPKSTPYTNNASQASTKSNTIPKEVAKPTVNDDLVVKIINLEQNNKSADILGLKTEDSVAHAIHTCKATLDNLRSLNYSDSKQMLKKELAIGFTKKAYGEWYSKRIARLHQEKKVSPQDLLETTPENFLKRYESIYNILSIGTQENKSNLQLLTQAYESYLIKGLQCFLDSENKWEIRDQKHLFLGKSLIAVNELFELRKGFISEWEGYKKIQKDVNPDLKQKQLNALKNNYEEAVRFQIPSYSDAMNLILDLKPTDLRFQNDDAIALRKNESWYKEKIDFCNQLIKKLRENSVDSFCIEKIEELKALLSKYESRLKRSLFNKQKATLSTKKHKTWASHISSYLFATYDDKAFLTKYRNDLIILLGLNEDTKQEEIKKRYEEWRDSFALIDNSTNQLKELNDLYAHYERSLDLLLLLQEKYEQFFPESNSLNDLHGKYRKLINDIKIENDFQNKQTENSDKNKIIASLGTAQKKLNVFWEKFLKKNGPEFFAADQILNKISAVKDKIYVPILEITLDNKFISDPKQVFEKYTKLDEKLVDKNNVDTINGNETVQKAKEWLLIAYKEWEADRILNNTNNVLGLSNTVSKKDKIKRYRHLQMYLHPDKNGSPVIPEEIKKKIIDASKMLDPMLYN